MRFVFILFIMFNVNISMAGVNILHKLTLYHDERDVKIITIEEGENIRMLKVRDAFGNVVLSKGIEDGVVSLFTLTDNGDHFFLLSGSGVAYVLTGYLTTSYSPRKIIEIYSREALSFCWTPGNNSPLPTIISNIDGGEHKFNYMASELRYIEESGSRDNKNK